MKALLNELHAHYNGAKPDPYLINHHLEDNHLSPESALKIVVASDSGGEVVGLPAFAFLNSPADPAPGEVLSVHDQGDFRQKGLSERRHRQSPVESEDCARASRRLRPNGLACEADQ